jgi:hypothetical protein
MEPANWTSDIGWSNTAWDFVAASVLLPTKPKGALAGGQIGYNKQVGSCGPRVTLEAPDMGLVVERLSVGIFHVTEGSGEGTIGDKHIERKQGDTFVAPGWHAISPRATSDAQNSRCRMSPCCGSRITIGSRCWIRSKWHG